MSCLPRAVFKSLHRQTLIYLCTQVCTLLTYSLYAISNVLCPLSCVVCMRALYLCMHVSALENHSSLLSSWFFWNRISQSSPELTEKPSLVSQLALGISYPSFWLCVCYHADQRLHRSWGSKLWSSCLHDKCFKHEAISSALCLSFLKKTLNLACYST